MNNITRSSPSITGVMDGKKFRINIIDYDEATGHINGVFRFESARKVNSIDGILTPQGMVLSLHPNFCQNDDDEISTHTLMFFQGNLKNGGATFSGNWKKISFASGITDEGGECEITLHERF